MCQDIGTSRCWSRVGDVEGPSGCQCCCCGGANPRRSGRPVRPVEVVGYPLGGPIPLGGRHRFPTSVPSAAHIADGDPCRGGRAGGEPTLRAVRPGPRRRPPHRSAWHLQQRHQITVSPSTVRRRFVDLGLVEPNAKKRPKSSYVRFEADLPNEMWQSDFTHWPLSDGSTTEIITWLDDHSRYALSVTVHRRITGPIVVDTFNQTCVDHGVAASTLTDNAMVYTTRFSGGKGGRNAFEARLAHLGTEQKNSTPNHPTTCGKVERFQQTLKKWLTAQPPANNLNELQALLNEFVDTYNHNRPHRALKRSTPAAVYNRLPKATPEHNGADVHFRVRHDRVDKTGSVTLRHNSRLHHIGIGRAHKHTPVTLLVADLDIRVIATQTGELLRHLTLDPTRDYQPQNQP